MNFPSDFTKSWPSSDVILVAKDAEGNKQELHATRTYLSAFSSFFESMFSSEFKEANSNSVELSCSYEALKLILDIIYGHSRNYLKVRQTYDVDVLMELYKTADYLDIPFIRGLCIEQMMDRPSVEMATGILELVTSGLDLHDTLIMILTKLKPEEMTKFLAIDNSQLHFSKEDVTAIYNVIAKKPLPNSDEYDCWNSNKNLLDLYKAHKHSLIDYTQKWPWSDVLFKTKNSDGNELFSCKAVLAMVSPYFSKRFSPQQQSDSMDFAKIKVDVDFIIMKNILAIVHQCYNTDEVNPEEWSHCFLIYVMFCITSEDKLDIPIVRDVCTKCLLKTKEYAVNNIHLDMATKITDAKSYILENIDTDELLEWIHTPGYESSKVYDVEDDQYTVAFTDKKKPVLSLNDVRVIVEKLLEEYNE